VRVRMGVAVRVARHADGEDGRPGPTANGAGEPQQHPGSVALTGHLTVVCVFLLSLPSSRMTATLTATAPDTAGCAEVYRDGPCSSASCCGRRTTLRLSLGVKGSQVQILSSRQAREGPLDS
jgi:hypothetical protein